MISGPPSSRGLVLNPVALQNEAEWVARQEAELARQRAAVRPTVDTRPAAAYGHRGPRREEKTITPNQEVLVDDEEEGDSPVSE